MYSLSEAIKRKIKKNVPKKADWEGISTYVIRNVKANYRKNKTPPLESIKHREYLEKYGNATGISYGTSRPNLTISGELLESIKPEFKKNSLIISPTGNHKKYQGKTKKVGNRTSNFEIAKHMKKIGRNFLKMTPTMKKIVLNMLKMSLRKHLKK